jgi:ribonuclease E
VIQPEPAAPAPVSQHSDHTRQEAARAPSTEETAQEAEKAAARRRSTVREKVSFLVDAQPAAATAAEPRQVEPPTAAPAPAQPEPEPASDNAPRKAGWWSRRFGSGE